MRVLVPNKLQSTYAFIPEYLASSSYEVCMRLLSYDSVKENAGFSRAEYVRLTN